MTKPEQSTGPAHPARAAGYALLGVAAIALVIGVASLFVGGPDDDTPAAQPTPPSATSGTPGTPGTSDTPGTSETPGTSDTPGASDTASPTSEPTTPAPSDEPPTVDPTTGAADTPPPPPVATIPKPPVRVYNNSTTQGLAARATGDVERAGWQVAEKGNYSSGNIPTTTVYYRPGTNEESSARELATLLKAEVKPRFDGIQAAQPGIIVIVTNDYKGPGSKVS
ncbi:LytR C-terminal domain-containing protein [Saccharothrix isguenensis]